MSQHTLVSQCRACGLRKRVPLRISVCADCTRELVMLWVKACKDDEAARDACAVGKNGVPQ